MANNNTEIAVLGGGCFWCIEAVFTEIKGVTAVTSVIPAVMRLIPPITRFGGEKTGHAEVVQVEFDPTKFCSQGFLRCFCHP